MDRSRPHEPAAGFTLIEIAVVVAIIGALMTLGLSFLNAQLLSSAKTITTRKQEVVKDALIAYLGLHKRLPCPDVANNTNGTVDTSGVTGQEDVKVGTVCVAPFGVLPYTALGLSKDAATDGWSNFFSYRVDTDASAVPTPCGSTIDWSQAGCFGAGKRGRIAVNDSSVISGPILTQNSIAVIVAHGPNGLGAWVGATANVAPPVRPETCEERRNADGDMSGCSLAANTYFRGERDSLDDVVAWIDASEAINSLSRQGAVKSVAAQLNEDLQTLYDLTLGLKIQGTTVTGTPPVSVCGNSVADTPQSFMSDPAGHPRLDPWGNLYAVGEGAGPGQFPICVCSSGSSVSIPTPVQCPVASPPATLVCKTIDKPLFNSYLTKSGMPACP